MEVFVGGYGLTATSGLVDAVLEVQRDGIEQVCGLAATGQQPRSTGSPAVI